ncbi:MAG: hypothetical protein JJ914_11285, partial [Altererythrobacter sp.]|uniref:hypothetical protein n=3 Tax=Altererythrobacter sp. TaxID=1872480 RepID=UPI001B248EBF
NLDASYAGLKVYEVLPNGYVQTLGQAGYTITGTSGTDQTGLNFANFEDMNLSGYKWADVDGNSDWNEPDSAVLSGWTIVIDDDQDPTNGYLLADITDSDGKYEFTGLNVNTLTDFGNGDVLGNYTDQTLYVYEIQKDGFVQTYGGYTFSITSGLVVAGALGVAEEGNFGNEMLLGANRTPGFWQSTLGQSLYDGDNTNNGDANGDGVPDGDKNFEEEGWSTTDLLTKYGIDTDSNGTNDTFILWDENGDGFEDQGEDIFLTAAELHEWVSGGKADEKGGLDGLEKLERDLGAAFLNTLNNHSLATPGSNSEDPQIIKTIIDDDIYDSYTAAVEFILEYDGDLDGEADIGKGALQKKWKNEERFGDDDEDGFIQNDGNNGITGSQAHNELSAFNENGEAVINGELTQILMDGDDYSSDPVQDYLAIQEQLLIQSGVVVESTTTIEDDMMVAQINAPL